MALAGRKPSNEVRFCWEQVLRTNRLFRISTVFAPADRARQLLPLHALFGAVEEISSKHSDEDLARRKLDWWRQECARLENQGSEHPILRELLDSGAYQAMRKDSLAQLFDDAESRLDPRPPPDVDGLKSLCSISGRVGRSERAGAIVAGILQRPQTRRLLVGAAVADGAPRRQPYRHRPPPPAASVGTSGVC